MVYKEPYYITAMAFCLKHRIKIYPIPINNVTYVLEVDYNGIIWRSKDHYKSNPKFKKDKVWHKEVYKLYQLLITLKQNKNMKNILEEVSSIIYDRDSEKAKDYGPFEDSMKDAAKIMTILTGKHITTRDFYKAMMSLKLARLKYSDKHDTYMDLVAYIASASELKDKPLIDKDFGE